MKICNWKRAGAIGAGSAIATMLGYIVFTYAVSWIIGGKEFITYNNVQLTKTDQLLFIAIQAAGAALSAFLSILFLRYDAKKFLAVYLPVSILTYIALLFLMIFMVTNYRLGYPTLASWDSLYYAIVLFPAGAGIGSSVSIIIHEMKNRRAA